MPYDFKQHLGADGKHPGRYSTEDAVRVKAYVGILSDIQDAIGGLEAYATHGIAIGYKAPDNMADALVMILSGDYSKATPAGANLCAACLDEAAMHARNVASILTHTAERVRKEQGEKA